MHASASSNRSARQPAFEWPLNHIILNRLLTLSPSLPLSQCRVSLIALEPKMAYPQNHCRYRHHSGRNLGRKCVRQQKKKRALATVQPTPTISRLDNFTCFDILCRIEPNALAISCASNSAALHYYGCSVICMYVCNQSGKKH